MTSSKHQTKNIWQRLEKPLFIQAPMEDVTDTVFRRIIARNGKPDLFFTEFTNVEGLMSKRGRRHVAHRLAYTEEERPIIAQIWGANPENYYEGAQYVRELGFDGVDINMGCPQKSVIKKGLCAALIENHELAGEIIQATIDGAGDMPVSVKTRIGVKEIVTEEWVEFLLGFDIAALTIHGRTVREMSKVPAHWDEIGKAVQVRDRMASKTLIIGNGDIMSRDDGLEKVRKYSVDGVMIGRGIFDDIEVFSSREQRMNAEERLQALIDHLQLFEETWGPSGSGFTKNSQMLKKYYKIYVRDFSEASNVRAELMQLHSLEETISRLREIKDSLVGQIQQ